MALLGNTNFYGGGGMPGAVGPQGGAPQLRGSADLLNSIKGNLMQPRNAMLMQALGGMPGAQAGQALMGQAVPPMQDMQPPAMGGLPGQLPGSNAMANPMGGMPGMGAGMPSVLDAIPRNLQGQGMGATAPQFQGMPNVPRMGFDPMALPPGVTGDEGMAQMQVQNPGMNMDNLRRQLFEQYMQSQGGGI